MFGGNCPGGGMLELMSGKKLSGEEMYVGGLGNVQMSMHDYKSLRVAVMICDTLVNTHTHTHMRPTHYRQSLTPFDLLYY